MECCSLVFSSTLQSFKAIPQAGSVKLPIMVPKSAIYVVGTLFFDAEMTFPAVFCIFNQILCEVFTFVGLLNIRTFMLNERFRFDDLSYQRAMYFFKYVISYEERNCG
jgi:hypothetical protein